MLSRGGMATALSGCSSEGLGMRTGRGTLCAHTSVQPAFSEVFGSLVVVTALITKCSCWVEGVLAGRQAACAGRNYCMSECLNMRVTISGRIPVLWPRP